MPTISFPYGKGSLKLDIPDHRFAGEIVSKLHQYKTDLSQEQLVRDALKSPIGKPKLSVLAKGKRNVVILASDHTRPVPSKIIMPLLLGEIRAGNPEAEITILIATGCHRESSLKELENKFGSKIVKEERIIIHDCDSGDMAHLGKLPSGGELFINGIADRADLLLSEGFIEPHFFAGFSGGRKSVLPGIAARESVQYNHNADFIAHPSARTGVLENNPIHEDMVFAARAAKLAFICNVVINTSKEIIYAVAGDFESAHMEGCAFLCSVCEAKKKMADIVVVSNGGYPLDQNIYQAVKGMSAAEAVVREGGVIIMLAKSEDGHGAAGFYKTFAEEKDLDHMMSVFLSTPKPLTRVDQWQSQIFARVLKHARVIYVSDAPDFVVENMHMIPGKSPENALKIAEELLGGSGATIAAIPDGVSVIIYD